MSNLAKIERLTSQLKNIKQHAAAGARIGMHSMLTVAGGGAAGILDAKLSKVPNTNLDLAGLIGSGGVIAAVTGFFDQHSDGIGAWSAGMLAYVTGREAKEFASSRL